MKACPDEEWRLIFALARYGGLRCPSELLALKWTDFDWERERFRIDSPKTGVRWVPMFPELRPYLDKAWMQPGSPVHVISRYRDTNMNLRTQLHRIIRRAGLEPWPKLFQNLRSTRETELMESFPAHVVTAWIGNSEAVARKHYLQVTDEHFERAARGNTPGNTKVTQKSAQPTPAQKRTKSQKGLQETTKASVSQGFMLAGATESDSVQPFPILDNIPPRGVEPLSSD